MPRLRPVMESIEVNGRRLEYVWFGRPPGEAPTLVFLHEGLGSAAGWQDFPRELSETTGCGALAYSRLGYGGSDPLERPFDVDFMHREALEWLPGVLAATGVSDPIFVGHSDGASIALIYTASGGRALGLSLEAPHVFVEQETIAGITNVKNRYETGMLRMRLERGHGANTDTIFRAWTGIWLDPRFRAWDIRELLPSITCPTLVIQGQHDEFGTVAQVRAVEELVAGLVETRLLSKCAHLPHRESPEEVIAAMRTFVARIVEGAGGPA